MDGAIVDNVVESHGFPARREIFVDDQSHGLRITWHVSEAIFVVSIWRGDRCIETFHLDPAEAARLAAFVGTSLASAVPPAVQSQAS